MTDIQTMVAQQEGFILWLTGLPASGKTTIGRVLQAALAEQGIHTLLLDSDELREILTPEPTYTAAEREWFYMVLGQWALWLARNQCHVIVAATANLRRYRDVVRMQSQQFVEVWVRCDLAVCQARDLKGIYATAAENPCNQVPGIGSSYEPPQQAEIEIETDKVDLQTAVQKILSYLETEHLLKNHAD